MFCHTRWTVRGDSITIIIENYNVLKQLWEECLGEKLDPDIKGILIGVQTQMSKFNLLFGMHLSERILKITDNLSRTLQAESMSASEAQFIAKQTVETLTKMRSENMFDLFYKHVECLKDRTSTEDPVLPRKRKAPTRFEIGEGDTYHSPTV